MLRFFTALAVSITFTGDILLDRGVRTRIDACGVESLFTSAVDSVLRASDIVVGNLECPATNIHAPTFKRFVFRAEPAWLAALRSHGFTHLNLANNHSVDQGRRGLEDTYNQILSHGMTPVGAGPTLDEACKEILIGSSGDSLSSELPVHIYLIPTLRLPLEHFVPLPMRWSVSQEPDSALVNRVAALRQREPKAIIIVTPHWGWEHHLQPAALQRQLAYSLIDAGADIIIGHHPHTLQTVETYRGRRIFYSLGNFIFDQHSPLNARASLVTLHITPDSLRVEATPLQILHCAPHVISGATSECHGTHPDSP